MSGSTPPGAPPSPPPASPPPQAELRSRLGTRNRISLIWAIPIVTVLIAAWLAYDTLSRRGPLITITFQTAEGLVSGQSHVKHKDVDMGQIESIRLTQDFARVVVTVRMTRAAEPLLTEGAEFWVVKPRLFAGNISGLSTLLSGAYIELLPSPNGGEEKTEFQGLEDPPVLQSDTPGRTFLLTAQRIGSISVGSPVFYRDLPAGEVLGWEVGDMAENVTIHTFVRAPFDQYVHDGTRFWNASGVSVKLGAEGVQLQLESLRALLLGGIAFETAKDAAETPTSPENQNFTLYPDQDAANAAQYRARIRFVSVFTGSLSGLAAGSAVRMQGLRVGHVLDVHLEYDKTTDRITAPVTFEVEPERVRSKQEMAESDQATALAGLIRQGLRAQIETASFITGQQVVSLAMVPDAAPAQLTQENGIYVMPSVAGGFGDLARTAGELLAKVNQIPFEQIGNNLNETLRGTAKLTNSPELHEALTELNKTLKSAQDVVQRLDVAAGPTLKRLPEIAAALQDTVGKVNKLVGTVDQTYGGDSRFDRELDRLLQQLNETARSVRVLADLLSRHPEALIRGRTNEGAE